MSTYTPATIPSSDSFLVPEPASPAPKQPRMPTPWSPYFTLGALMMATGAGAYLGAKRGTLKAWNQL